MPTKSHEPPSSRVAQPLDVCSAQAEHAGIWGPDGLLRAGAPRRSADFEIRMMAVGKIRMMA